MKGAGMRLNIIKSKNACSFYVIKSVTVDGRRTTKIVEKLGTLEELKEKLNGQDPYEWANNYVANLNRIEMEGKEPDALIKYSHSKIISKDEQRHFNGGYLFLQRLYYKLGLNNICKNISARHKITYDLDSILSRLLYSRIIYPGSKLNTHIASSRFIEQPNFELQHIYRALDVIATENDFIQSELYKNSNMLSKRNTGVLYYDCTNYFFEIEQESGLKQYGISKEHRPNPIVQMGLFMDANGIPLAFDITSGNTNEQTTLKPLEEKILKDFNLSKFVVCTDAGLASYNNRKFNNIADRAFVTTQSLKTLKKFIQDWAIDTKDWSLTRDNKLYDISELNEEMFYNDIFYKHRYIVENGIEQRIIVTYSIKYKNYQRAIRNSQIERALEIIDKAPSKLSKHNQNDFKRFIKKTSHTCAGEIAEQSSYSIRQDIILKEEALDGFYAVCTNLQDTPEEIIKVNRRRWEIEECFRILKTEFRARPVYLSNDQRIKAHFITCFLSLVLFRYLEQHLDYKYTCSQIIKGLKDMNFLEMKGEGYIPVYTRNDFTDDLHEASKFRTDYQILSEKQMKKIFKETKK